MILHPKLWRKSVIGRKNYDCADMAISVANGESYAQAKIALQTGSYLIELDENGDIQNYTVTTHSTQISSADNNEQGVKRKTDDMIHARKTICEITCQTAHCGRYIPHFDFGAKPSPIVPYRHLPQSLSGMTADCRSLV